jgi:prepilin-type N-terminal cleavage/methylation domain-containing protein
MAERRRHKCQRSGFTLLELLVVIAIIAFIIGMLIPSFKRSMRLAASTICMHNLNQIGQAVQMYRYENDGWLPMNTGNVGAWHRPIPNSGVWFTKIHPTYLLDPMVFSCPDDPFRFKYQERRIQSNVNLPAASDFASYGINSFITKAGSGKLANLDRFRPTRPLDTILLGDLGPDKEIQQRQSGMIPGPLRNASQLAWDDGVNLFQRTSGKPWITRRHLDGINMATLDGGVRPASTADAVHARVMTYYSSCAAGGCTLCTELRLAHYTFARSRLYWWTGPIAIVE